MKKLEEYIRAIPDFPEPGIIFRDVTTIAADKEGMQLVTDQLADLLKDVEFDAIAGLEARGFMFGAPVAYKLGKAFIPIRKKGKLPCETISEEYDLEYGKAVIEVHKDALKPGDRVVILDDLIATGGSAKAAIKLVERLDAKVVKLAFIIELAGLKGREALGDYEMSALITYEGK